MIKEALKNFFETIKSLNDKTDKTQADYIRKISEANKERAEKERKEKEERHYKERHKTVENIVNKEIMEAAKRGDFFVEIYKSTLNGSSHLFCILQDDYREYFESRGYTFCVKYYPTFEFVEIGWYEKEMIL